MSKSKKCQSFREVMEKMIEEAEGLTRGELSRRSGITRSALHRICATAGKTGGRGANPKTLLSLANALEREIHIHVKRGKKKIFSCSFDAFGEHVDELRKGVGSRQIESPLSIAKLAINADMTPQNVREIRRGAKLLTDTTATRLAEALDFEFFFTIENVWSSVKGTAK